MLHWLASMPSIVWGDIRNSWGTLLGVLFTNSWGTLHDPTLGDIPSGNLYKKLLKMAIYSLVSFPIYSYSDFP